MRTSTMNAKLILTSAALVVAAIGSAEVLKPAEAHAAGVQATQVTLGPDAAADLARGQG